MQADSTRARAHQVVGNVALTFFVQASQQRFDSLYAFSIDRSFATRP